MALAVFVVGTGLSSAPYVQSTMADIPWEYMPKAVAEASAGFYDATFISAAVVYVKVMHEIVDLQVGAYQTLGAVGAVGIGALSSTPPVAAVAHWYVDAAARVDSRLSPQ